MKFKKIFKLSGFCFLSGLGFLFDSVHADEDISSLLFRAGSTPLSASNPNHSISVEAIRGAMSHGVASSTQAGEFEMVSVEGSPYFDHVLRDPNGLIWGKVFVLPDNSSRKVTQAEASEICLNMNSSRRLRKKIRRELENERLPESGVYLPSFGDFSNVLAELSRDSERAEPRLSLDRDALLLEFKDRDLWTSDRGTYPNGEYAGHGNDGIIFQGHHLRSLWRSQSGTYAFRCVAR
jgi:hypothetical protein